MVVLQFRVQTNEKTKGRDLLALEANQPGLAGWFAHVVGTSPAVNPFRLLCLSFGVVDGENGSSRTNRQLLGLRQSRVHGKQSGQRR
jgi:hypothetical protein